MEEQETWLSGLGRATGENWEPVGQVVFGYNFGKNPKYRRSVQQRCTKEEGRIGSAQLRCIHK
jgi:hypothetical protein